MKKEDIMIVKRLENFLFMMIMGGFILWMTTYIHYGIIKKLETL